MMKKSRFILPFALAFLLGTSCQVAFTPDDLTEPISNESWIDGVENDHLKYTDWKQFADAAGINIDLNEVTPEMLAANTQQMRDRLGENLKPVTNVDPRLVGRNFVFDKEWLQYIGNCISEENFIKWRDRTDQVYDAYAYLTGTLARGGQRISIDFENLDINTAAVTHLDKPLISFNRCGVNLINNFLAINGNNSWGFAQMHEMSHIFDYKSDGTKQPWNAEAESMANFKVDFAMEMLGAKFRRDEFNYASGGNGIMEDAQTFRNDVLAAVDENEKDNNLTTFAADGQHTSSEYDKYLYSLVQYVGCEPVILAFRSYTDPKLESLLYEKDNSRAIAQKTARTFIERVALYGGHPELLRQIADGILLEKEFDFAQPKQEQELLK